MFRKECLNIHELPKPHTYTRNHKTIYVLLCKFLAPQYALEVMRFTDDSVSEDTDDLMTMMTMLTLMPMRSPIYRDILRPAKQVRYMACRLTSDISTKDCEL